MSDKLRKQAEESALAGLAFYLRNQVKIDDSADQGRYPFIVNIKEGRTEEMTTNWLTGILVSTMLNAHQATGEQKYFDSAEKALRFLKSMQDFCPWQPRTFGAIHEGFPMDVKAHPRDGLSCAMGMLDYARATGDQDVLSRARSFGDWFVSTGMEAGYPCWTIRFDDQPWLPFWHGSFHSGSGYFLVRLSETTGDPKYLAAAEKLLTFYNENMLSDKGDITVIRDVATMKDLDACADPFFAPIGWIMMHRYNDDFGALANLACSRATGKACYQEKALLFLNRMKQVQRPDGGFGPDEWPETIPDAAGIILLELMNARKMGLMTDSSSQDMADRAVQYLIRQQFRQENSPYDGAFHGLNSKYVIDRNYCSARASTYAVMGLLEYAGKAAVNFTV